MRSAEGWLLELVASVPEVKPFYDGMIEVDAELFVKRVARWAQREGYGEPVKRLLATLERDYRLHGPKVRGIIESSFVEPLAGSALVQHFGPNLRRAMHPHALGHAKRRED